MNYRNKSTAHTSWNSKYHIVIAPKFRRKVFYGEKKVEIGAILRKLCEWKQINILEADVYAGGFLFNKKLPLRRAGVLFPLTVPS